MHQLDLTGQRFGKLVVLKRIKKRGSFWFCRCDCGTEKLVRTNNLRGGSAVSCGCHRKAILDSLRWGKCRHFDLLGKRFGRWTAISYISNPDHTTAWLCRCDCGTERPVLTRSLRAGVSTSCGCLLVEKSRKSLAGRPRQRIILSL